MSVKTCPKCGALITPQLERCRQCGTYLHGTRAEGWFLAMLPGPLRSAPGSGAIAVAIVVAYLATAVLALPSSPLGFTSYTLRHVGATHGPSILLGEWWRLATSIFVHHDLVHLGFNLYALAIVGPVVEKLYDRKKMVLMYLLAGVASMAVSHFWYVSTGKLLVTSGGASGAVCGLIGAAWVGARRFTPPQPHIAQGMKRWAVALAVFGFVVPGINNAAHGGGLVVGAALAAVFPIGITRTVSAQRMLSVVTTLAVAGVLACFGFMLSEARGYPGSLDDDFYVPTLAGIRLGSAPDWEDSAQVAADEACRGIARTDRPIEEKLHACEFAMRVNAHHGPTYTLLAQLEEQAGNEARAQRLVALAQRLNRERISAASSY